MDSFENTIKSYNMKFIENRGTLITAHISDLHFPVMNPQKQYQILEEQFIQKIASLPRLDLVCVNGDLFDHKISLSSDATLYASMFIAHLVELVKIHNATLIILQGTASHDANQDLLSLYATSRC